MRPRADGLEYVEQTEKGHHHQGARDDAHGPDCGRVRNRLDWSVHRLRHNVGIVDVHVPLFRDRNNVVDVLLLHSVVVHTEVGADAKEEASRVGGWERKHSAKAGKDVVDLHQAVVADSNHGGVSAGRGRESQGADGAVMGGEGVGEGVSGGGAVECVHSAVNKASRAERIA